MPCSTACSWTARQMSGASFQVVAGSSVNTGSPSSSVDGRAAIARGSSGGFAIGSAGGPVDAVLGALPDDADAQTSPISSLVQDLALEQVLAQGRQSSRRPRD